FLDELAIGGSRFTEGDDFEPEGARVEAEAFRALFAKTERFAVFYVELPLVFVLASTKIFKRSIVENVAVLVDLSEGRSAVPRHLAKHFRKIFRIGVDGACHETSLHA